MLLTLIIGLPASGKSTLAANLALLKPAYIIDDPISLSELPSIKSDIIITDPYFCITKVRKLAIEKLKEKYDCKIKCIFFENDPLQCLDNAKRRDRKVVNFIRTLSGEYEIPEGAHVVPVWKSC